MMKNTEEKELKRKAIVLITICVMVYALYGCANENEDKSLLDYINVSIDETTFPDSIFRDYVSQNFDINGDGSLSLEEISEVKEISVADLEISSLNGIEYFIALETLDCYMNYLDSLDLSKNANLIRLECSENKLTGLDLSKNTSLEELFVDYNELENLDLSNNVELYRLCCSYNKLSNLDVSNNVKLGQLECIDNQISSLDMSNNIELFTLDCSENQIENLDLSKDINLENLTCYSNPLDTLILSTNVNTEDDFWDIAGVSEGDGVNKVIYQ